MNIDPPAGSDAPQFTAVIIRLLEQISAQVTAVLRGSFSEAHSLSLSLRQKEGVLGRLKLFRLSPEPPQHPMLRR